MDAFLLILALFAAVCLWQLLAGLGKLRTARANPDNPQAAALARIGKIQAFAGGAMLVANIVLNLPTVLSVL